MAKWLNIGPATISHNSVNLGKTLGGVQLQLEVIESRPVSTRFDLDETIVGGIGNVSFYDFETLTLTNTTELLDFAVMILLGTTYKVTLYSSKLLIATNFDFGTNKQSAVACKIVFQADGSGNVIKIERP